MPKLKHLIVPTDLSTESSAAAKWAADVAGDAKITVLFVPPMLAALYPDGTAPVEIMAADAKVRSQAKVDLERWAKRYTRGAKQIALEIRSGDPADEIVAAAADLRADLIAMTTHARAGWRHVVLGSVTQKVLRGAACPVLVIPPRRT